MRAVLIHVLVLSLSLGLLVAGASTNVSDLPHTSFEDTPIGVLPSGWQVPETMKELGFHAQIDRDPLRKSLAVRLTARPPLRLSQPGVMTPNRSRGRPGSVLYSLDAKAHEGRNLSFHTQALLSVNGPTARYPGDGPPDRRRRATAWMRFDRSTGPPLFFQQVEIEAHLGWQTIKIDAAVPLGTEQIHLGLTLYGEGEAWIDDVWLEDTGESGHEAARPLTDTGLRNLVALAELYGVTRYFHPSDEAAGTDWNRFLFDAINVLESAANESERAVGVDALFAPIAPTMTLTSTGADRGNGSHGWARSLDQKSGREFGPGFIQDRDRKPDFNLELVPDRVLIWDHHGVGAGRDETYVSERRADETLSADLYPEPLKSFRVDLGSSTHARIPLAVYADANGSLPRSRPTTATGTGAVTRNAAETAAGTTTATAAETAAGTTVATTAETAAGTTVAESVPVSQGRPHEYLPNYHDRTTRLAAVIVLWNVIEHFFPYFEESQCDWPRHLPLLLAAAANTDDREQFLAALQVAVADLGDGHADVYPFYDLNTGRLPLIWQWLDDALIVIHTASKTVHRGDRVVTIDGVPVDEYLTELETRISSPTRRWKRQRALDRTRKGQIGDRIRLGLERTNGSLAETEMEFWSQPRVRNWLARTTLPAFHRWTDGMVYVDLSRATDTQMRDWIPELADARGVILDMRGYPTGLSTRFLEHIVDRPTRSLQWHVPVTRAPHQTETYVSSSNWTIRPQPPRITSPIALLQDEHAISRAETYLALLKESGVGRSFGSPTAGTNGNSNAIVLPGDFRVTFTGMEVRQPDGLPFHGIGVLPDVLVRPSREDVRTGRDEVLEAARSWIRTVSPNLGRSARRP